MDRTQILRTVRQRVAKEVLRPRGFSRRGSSSTIFNRLREGQIHGIEFQTNQYGGSFTVNIGFHYVGLPACDSFETKEYSQFSPTDFMLHGRPSAILGGRDKWSSFGESPEVYEHRMTELALQAIDTIDSCSSQWDDPKILLELIPPHVVGARSRDPVWNVDRETVKILLPGWNIFEAKLAFCLAHLALRSGRNALAVEYAARGLLVPMSIPCKAALEALLQRAKAL